MSMNSEKRPLRSRRQITLYESALITHNKYHGIKKDSMITSEDSQRMWNKRNQTHQQFAPLMANHNKFLSLKIMCFVMRYGKNK